MSKLQELKEKAKANKEKFAQTLNEKLDKIAFLKKFREPKAQKAPSPHSLNRIFKEGGAHTRLQVVLLYVFLIASLGSTAVVLVRVTQRMREAGSQRETGSKISTGLEHFTEKVLMEATTLSLGKLTLNALVEGKREAHLSVDIWLRVSDPNTAAYVQNHEEIFVDRCNEAFQELYSAKVDLLTADGKEKAKDSLKAAMNKVLKSGKVEEVFFHNLVMQ